MIFHIQQMDSFFLRLTFVAFEKSTKYHTQVLGALGFFLSHVRVQFIKTPNKIRVFELVCEIIKNVTPQKFWKNTLPKHKKGVLGKFI